MEAHEILLVEQFAGRRLIAQLRDAETDPDFEGKDTLTSKVHHSNELHVTTDVVLDAVTVTPSLEYANRVEVQRGTVQWFGKLVKIEEPLLSAPLSAFDKADCDPSLEGTDRWSLLCLYVDLNTGNPALKWANGIPSHGYPAVPPQTIPLALVRQSPGGLVSIQQDDIVNFRSVRSTYAPAAQFSLPPVQEPDDLYFYENVANGTTALVISLGQWWYYKDEIWAPHEGITFDNTFYKRDLTTTLTRIDLPWSVRNYPELLVVRDGQIMAPGDDYLLTPGPNSFVTFNYTLYPGMRILFIRNPFLGAAYSPLAEDNLPTVHHFYVNGRIGHDAYSGTEERPFKTLQAAFDALPLQSKHGYHLHVAQLDIADVIPSNQYGQVTYGILENRSLRFLKIDVQPDCDWDDSVLHYLYVLSNVGVFTQVDAAFPVYYPIRLDHCTSYFASTSTKATRVVIAGGDSGWHSMEVEVHKQVIFASSAVIYTSESTYAAMMIRTGAYIQAENCVIQTLQGDSGGYINAVTTDFTALVSTRSTFLDLVRCNLSGLGNFLASRISCDACVNTGLAGQAPLFFHIQNCSVLELTNCTVENNIDTPIEVQRSSVVHITNGLITNNFGNGVRLQDNCSIFVDRAEISKNHKHGVMLVRSCHGEFSGATGSGNSFYGIYCEKYSSASRHSGTSLSGFLGAYYEEIPGGTTVCASGADLHPSTLDNKVKAGPGLQMEVLPTGTPANNYQVELRVNTVELAQLMAHANGQATVFQYNGQLLNGQSLDIGLAAPGTTHITAVQARINSPVPRVRHIPMETATLPFFIHMDILAGTAVSDTEHLTLKNRPGLGYPTNSPYWVVTKTGTHASLQAYAASLISSVQVLGNTPAQTNIRVAVSVSQGMSWLRWDGSTWVTLPGSSVLAAMQYAPEMTQFNAYTSVAWDALRALGKPTIDLCMTLQSTSSLVTPTVEAIEWHYTEYGFLLDVTSQFRRQFYQSRAVFENTGATLDPPILFTIVPVTVGTPGVTAIGFES